MCVGWVRYGLSPDTLEIDDLDGKMESDDKCGGFFFLWFGGHPELHSVFLPQRQKVIRNQGFP